MRAAADLAQTTDEAGVARIDRLRGMAFGAILMLLIEYGLGMWVNQFGNLPGADHGKGLFAAFGRAVADGPAGLGIHAVWGLVIFVMSVQVLVRSIMLRRKVAIVTSVVGAAAIIGAGVNGALFVGSGANGNSFGMAISAGVAILAYAVGLFSLSVG